MDRISGPQGGNLSAGTKKWLCGVSIVRLDVLPGG
uniref:Uncharacterized protein n=1 Tax=Anguilla anguilla TaxID=7936 RepID=A0A0E9UVN6_ANGAN